MNRSEYDVNQEYDKVHCEDCERLRKHTNNLEAKCVYHQEKCIKLDRTKSKSILMEMNKLIVSLRS